jgi:MFS family permease
MLPLTRNPGFVPFVAASMLARLGESALAVLLGITVYKLAGNALALGWLGLVEAAPAIGLVLLGGHVADRASRKRITFAARLTVAALCLVLALASVLPPSQGLTLLYTASFLIGCARAFEEPANSGLEAQVVPYAQAVRAASIIGTSTRACSLVGPPLGGIMFDLAGPVATYATIAGLLAASCLVILFGIANEPATPHETGTGMVANIAEGVRYVFSNQIIVGSMALDLFAVFFGGLTGLLPIFATDILGVGPAGVGLLRAAASGGALLAMVVAVRHPPRAHAGLALHIAIAGFGVAVVAFGLSTSFYLSMAALFAMGACDGISVVVRHAIVRVVAPGGMRGRIAAVRSVFINSSNELGDFESGVAASIVGPAPAVWLGGILTLVIVGITAWRAPKLRRLNLAELQAERTVS